MGADSDEDTEAVLSQTCWWGCGGGGWAGGGGEGGPMPERVRPMGSFFSFPTGYHARAHKLSVS